jgi:hypothetical protein
MKRRACGCAAARQRRPAGARRPGTAAARTAVSRAHGTSCTEPAGASAASRRGGCTRQGRAAGAAGACCTRQQRPGGRCPACGACLAAGRPRARASSPPACAHPAPCLARGGCRPLQRCRRRSTWRQRRQAHARGPARGAGAPALLPPGAGTRCGRTTTWPSSPRRSRHEENGRINWKAVCKAYNIDYPKGKGRGKLHDAYYNNFKYGRIKQPQAPSPCPASGSARSRPRCALPSAPRRLNRAHTTAALAQPLGRRSRRPAAAARPRCAGTPAPAAPRLPAPAAAPAAAPATAPAAAKAAGTRAAAATPAAG